MEFLVEEEERHHALFERIATSLHDRFDWAKGSSALPLGTEPAGHTDPDAVLAVQGLEPEERRGAHELRDLARHDQHYQHYQQWLHYLDRSFSSGTQRPDQ
jgi:hypothetical protein